MAPPSSPSSSQQSSLYQYYTPIASNDSSSPSTSRVLQPSTHQNIPARRSRIAIKRPLRPSIPISPSPKKAKQDITPQIESPAPQSVSPRRHERETLPRSLIMRGLQGHRGGLAERTLCPRIRLLILVTCLHEARHYFSRPIDMHNVQSTPGVGTFPFAVQCCNSIPLCNGIDGSQFACRGFR